MKRSLVSALLLWAVLVWTASAGTIVAFPSDDSTVIASAGSSPGQFCCFWSAARGDSITETFTGVGLASISGLDLSFGVAFNILSAGAHVDWAVSVNGTQVGVWSWLQGDGTGPVNLSYGFPSITGGGTYTIRMAVTNEVASGDGSIGIGYPGSATLSANAIPEPATLLLMGAGFLGIWLLKRR